MLITQRARQSAGSAPSRKTRTHTRTYTRHCNTHFPCLLVYCSAPSQLFLSPSLSQQEGSAGGGGGGGVAHCWVPVVMTTSHPTISRAVFLLPRWPDPVPSPLWSRLDWYRRAIREQCPLSLKAARWWDSGSHARTRIVGREGAACWECCRSNNGALPGNTSMPIQQITVVPARETASNGKSATRSKDKTEVSFWSLNYVFQACKCPTTAL